MDRWSPLSLLRYKCSERGETSQHYIQPTVFHWKTHAVISCQHQMPPSAKKKNKSVKNALLVGGKDHHSSKVNALASNTNFSNPSKRKMGVYSLQKYSTHIFFKKAWGREYWQSICVLSKAKVTHFKEMHTFSTGWQTKKCRSPKEKKTGNNFVKIIELSWLYQIDTVSELNVEPIFNQRMKNPTIKTSFLWWFCWRYCTEKNSIISGNRKMWQVMDLNQWPGVILLTLLYCQKFNKFFWNRKIWQVLDSVGRALGQEYPRHWFKSSTCHIFLFLKTY